jgi:hypothetical protein
MSSTANRKDLSWWLKFEIEKNRFGAPGKDHFLFERPLFRFSTNPNHRRTTHDLNEED